MNTTVNKLTEDQIIERAKRYADGLRNPKPKASIEDKQQRIQTALERAELGLITSDKRRMALLLRQAQLLLQSGDMRQLYATSVELAHMARLSLVGLSEAHPVLPSNRPPVFSSLPPNATYEDR